MRRLPGFLLAGFLVFLGAMPLAAQQGPGGLRGRYSIIGTVRDPQTNEGLEDIQVELRQFNGPTVGQVFTSQNGNFTFNNLPADTYDVIIERAGFERIDQQVSLTSNLSGIELELRRTRENTIAGSQVVSARELSIPHKAHDAMEKGMGLLYQKSDYPGSLKQFQLAIKNYPDYYEAYSQMGMAYMKMGDAANSEESLRKSIALSKDRYVDGYFILAKLLTDGKRFADAEAAARKAVELNANSWQGQFELARASYGMNHLTDAEESATTAAKLQPDHPETYLMLANIHGRTRNFAKLVEDLNAFLKLDPNGPQADQARQTRQQILQSLDDGPAEDSVTRPAPAH